MATSFDSPLDADRRLGDPSPLTPDDIRRLMPVMSHISESSLRRLNAELALQNLEAVQAFERSSSKLTRWLIWLTGALAVLTAVVTVYTVLLFIHSRRADGRFAAVQDGYFGFDTRTGKLCTATQATAPTIPSCAELVNK